MNAEGFVSTAGGVRGYAPAMTTRGADHYSDLSAEYLRKARLHLAEEDLTQASEKGWGAAAVAVKACAESRGMRHGQHRHFRETLQVLVDETGDEEMFDLFAIAEALHANYYENWLNRREVERHLGQVETLVGRLSSLV